MKSYLARILCLSFVTSCSAKPVASTLEEAPDFWNELTRFGFNRVFSYQDLVAKKDIATPKVPWSDTYWPTAFKGMAWRYHAPEDPAALKEEVQVAAFLRHFVDESTKDAPDPLLSPAEKYDLAFQYRHGLNLDPKAFLDLVVDLSTQDAVIKAKTNVVDKKTLLAPMVASLDNAAAAPAMPMTFAAWSAFLSASSGEKNKYLGIDANPGDDWSWEGHCHGWAPAAVMSVPPRHGVMALLGSKQVFFSEGDIRGLMTKAWADSAPNDKQYFLARRCESSPQDPDASIPANALGRGYSGTIQEAGQTQNFIILESLPRMTTLRGRGRDPALNFYRIRMAETGERLYLVENPDSGGFWTVPYLSDLDDAVRTKNFDLLKSVDATLTGCWDPNPASFHAVLLEQLDERKTGFAMDRTRTGQVWNQPIYAAHFDIGPLVAITAAQDAARAYRAAGTSYLAEVTVSVDWSGEPGSPSFSYGADFDLNQLEQTTYQYTLEFDAQHRLIGGEWGTLAAMDASSNAPDFLYGFAAGALPEDSLSFFQGSSRIDYSGIIGRLHACSVEAGSDGIVRIKGDALPYKNCTISKAN